MVAPFVAFALLTSTAFASSPSHVNTILGDESPIGTQVSTGNITTTGLVNTSDVGITDNTESTLSYHHGSSGGGDGAFAKGKFSFYAGVGFVGSGIGNVYGGSASGYATSTGPAIELGGEYGVKDHLGVGIHFSYQSASATDSYTTDGFNPTTFQPETYNNTDKVSISVIVLAARLAYHFGSNAKIDPYIGGIIGYCFVSASDNFTTNDPSQTPSTTSVSVTGAEFGVYGGLRYFFTDHIGAWVEIQYSYAAFTVDGVTTGVNTSNILNLGIAFKM